MLMNPLLAPQYVAIGTWPTPEKPRVDLGRFLVETLIAAGKFPAEVATTMRFDLAVDAALWIERALYPVDPDSPCGGPNPPKWCDVAGTEAEIFLMRALAENGVIGPTDAPAWRQGMIERPPGEVVPFLLNRAGVKPEIALRVAAWAFDASSSYPVPGGPWDDLCRDRPHLPICKLIHGRFETAVGKHLAQDIAIGAALHEEGLLEDAQFDDFLASIAALPGQFDPAGTLRIDTVPLPETPRFADPRPQPSGRMPARLADISPVLGTIIIDGIVAEPKLKAEISRAALIGKGYPGKDEIGFIRAFCETEYAKEVWPWPLPPEPCGMGPELIAAPRALALTAQLVKHGLWDKGAAIAAWQSLVPMVVVPGEGRRTR